MSDNLFKLVVDHSAGAAAVRVPCFACGAMLSLVEAQIDVNGPAFKAYYHRGCAPFGAELANHNAECRARGCLR